MRASIPADSELLQIVDTALAEAARRSGPWLPCRIGCTACCHGVFAISQLDAQRLRAGMCELASRDPRRAENIRTRARASKTKLASGFPGDSTTGLLAEGEAAERQFDDFANDEPCPALDSVSGACDLYDARPMTCRAFGPAVRHATGEISTCELCYSGATGDQIASCAVAFETKELEPTLIARAESETGLRGNTIVAFCLA
ncbi:MAG: YkgJ family cysteine cluster protein [Bryobacteraceae bacterium]